MSQPKMTEIPIVGKALHFDKMSATKHPTLFHIECRQLSFRFLLMHELHKRRQNWAKHNNIISK